MPRTRSKAEVAVPPIPTFQSEVEAGVRLPVMLSVPGELPGASVPPTVTLPVRLPVPESVPTVATLTLPEREPSTCSVPA